VVGWCLDSPCGGSIAGSLVWHLTLKLVGRHWRAWGDNIKMDFQKYNEDVDCIGVAQGRNKLRVLLFTVVNFRVT